MNYTVQILTELKQNLEERKRNPKSQRDKDYNNAFNHSMKEVDDMIRRVRQEQRSRHDV